jgi:Flp pilus assembly pilin Flp
MTEYIIITALIAIAAIAAVAMFGNGVRSQVGAMAAELGGKDGSAAITKAGTEGTNAMTEGESKKDLASYQSEKNIK